MAPLFDVLKTMPWTKDIPNPTCLVCEDANFSGPLVELKVLDSEEKRSLRIWIPHSYIVLAFDAADAREIGFHAAHP
ncbi:MAG TPA: hypothetical protein VFA72_17665 [Burkholderiales bacterium]|nr:hypothetical protein [Burkholderiales bacterium]